MADLRIQNPATTEAFAGLLAEREVVLPLTVSEEDIGVLLDAGGRGVIVVDVNNERDDDEVIAIAALVAMAVNTCGGFKAEVRHHG